MKPLLGEAYPAFEAAMLEGEPQKGLRVNTLKVSCAAFAELAPFPMQKSPLCTEGYIVAADDHAGNMSPKRFWKEL